MDLRTLANHSVFLALALGAACSTSDLGLDRTDQDLNPGEGDDASEGDDGDDALCAAVSCEAGSRCEIVLPQCITEPCDAIAICVPGDLGDDPGTTPCDAVRCAEGTHCEEVEVQCFTTPCDPVAECVPDVPRCGTEDPDPTSCAAVLCEEGTYCDDISGHAECIPLPSCELIDCARGYTCELVEVQCIRAPCPPQPECVPVDHEPSSCAVTLCPVDTYCDDISGHAKCIPLPSCDGVDCDEPGTHCELIEVQCIRAPCPPQPSCVED